MTDTDSSATNPVQPAAPAAPTSPTLPAPAARPAPQPGFVLAVSALVIAVTLAVVHCVGYAMLAAAQDVEDLREAGPGAAGMVVITISFATAAPATIIAAVLALRSLVCSSEPNKMGATIALTLQVLVIVVSTILYFAVR